MHVGGVAKLWKSPNGRLKTVASPPPLYPICFSIHREGGSDFLEVPLNTSNSPCLKTILYLQLPLHGMSFHKKKKQNLLPLTSFMSHINEFSQNCFSWSSYEKVPYLVTPYTVIFYSLALITMGYHLSLSLSVYIFVYFKIYSLSLGLAPWLSG